MTQTDQIPNPESRLVEIELVEDDSAPQSQEMEQERRVAIFDLLESNEFALTDANETGAGPYTLKLDATGELLSFDLRSDADAPPAVFTLSAAGYEQVVRDYNRVCATYLDAVRHLTPAQIETADSARRAIHDEAAQRLSDDLKVWARVNMATARRLFTLISILRASA